jgi:hypothetical protein
MDVCFMDVFMFLNPKRLLGKPSLTFPLLAVQYRLDMKASGDSVVVVSPAMLFRPLLQNKINGGFDLFQRRERGFGRDSCSRFDLEESCEGQKSRLKLIGCGGRGITWSGLFE